LAGLLARIGEGIHDPATMPFTVPWTDAPSPRLEHQALQHWWGLRATWTPQRWNLVGAVFVDGEAVGVQNLMAEDFAVVGVVKSGSWLGRRFQGQGIGTEMRAAVLHLAFEGLGAKEALSGAWEDNEASLAVSRSLGYAENGRETGRRRSSPATMVNLRLERARWHRRDDIVIEGLEPCLELFGGPTGAAPQERLVAES
jgi:RimJ/RimL family protein N-acetyltransferase